MTLSPDEQRYEQRAPGWVIRCLSCGFTEPWGKYGIRIGGVGKNWTLGWCSRCRRVRCHCIEQRKARSSEPIPHDVQPLRTAQPPALGIRILRWTARVLGTLWAMLVLVMIVGEGLPVIASQPPAVQWEFAAMVLWLAGFVIGWWYEGLAAILVLLGYALFHGIEGRFPLRWPLELPGVIGLIYATYWLLSRL